MNYFAHIAIAEDSDEARLGALLGDFAKGLDVQALPPAVRQGLDEHREVDRRFDTHPEVRAARAWFPADLERISGILLDVFVDHILASDWEVLCPTHLAGRSIEDVTGSLYRALDRHAAVLSPRLGHVAPAMVADDWVGSYGDERNVERVLNGISRRMKRDLPFARGMHTLRERRSDLRELTHSVFPEIALRAAKDRMHAYGVG